MNRAVDNSLSALLRVSGQNDDAEIQSERHFELNLKRMLGRCEAVTVDCMLEFLVHLICSSSKKNIFLSFSWTRTWIWLSVLLRFVFEVF